MRVHRQAGERALWSGTPGTGKSHLATALAAAACAKGYKVRFFRATELVTTLIEARDERTFLRLKSQLAKLDLLVLDELGYVPASKVGAELLFDVISTAYERTSMIVTTNLPFESWTEVLGSGAFHRRHPRSAHPPLQDHRDQGRELPAPRRQGPDTPDQAGHACGRGSGRQVTSDRSAPVFNQRAQRSRFRSAFTCLDFRVESCSLNPPRLPPPGNPHLGKCYEYGVESV